MNSWLLLKLPAKIGNEYPKGKLALIVADDEDKQLYERTEALYKENSRVSVSLLQRKLGLGYLHTEHIEIVKQREVICKDTVEEKVLQLQDQKRKLADGLGVGNLKVSDMIDLLQSE